MKTSPVHNASYESAGGVHLQLLGDFAATVADQRLDLADSSRRLLVYLALQRQPMSRAVAASALWPDNSDDRAVANLRTSLWRLPSPAGLDLVESVGATIRLSDAIETDVRRAEAVGWTLVNDPEASLQGIDPHVFFDELLPGWYDDWLIFERERLAQLQLRFLEALIHRLIGSVQLVQALDLALRLVHADPLREASHCTLINVYKAEGSHNEAERQAAECRRVLWETFHCAPSTPLLAGQAASVAVT